MASAGGDEGGTAAVAAEHLDWSNLPPDLLELLAKKVDTVSNYIRFRSVCRSWRTAASPAHLPPHLPLVMLPSDPFSDVRSFFSLSTNKAFAVPLPESRGKAVLNAAGGWLLLYDPSTNALSLLNPVTRAQLDLPSTSEFANNSELKTWFAFLSCNRSSAPSAEDCVVMLTNCRSEGNGEGSGAAFCKAGDAAWTELRTGLDEGELIMSMAYFDGRFYAITQKGRVTVCDPVTSSQPTVIEFFTDMTSFTSFQFAATATEFLLLVGLGFMDDRDGREKEYFVSVKLHLIDGLPCKAQIGGIDDTAIFMSNYQLMLLPANEIPGCKANYMYSSHSFYLQCYRDLEREMDVQRIWSLNLGNIEYEVDHISCGWPIPHEALDEPRFVLEPRWLAYAVRHRFPLSRWFALNLA